MQWYEIVILVALCAYAIYRQTQRHEVVGSTRFKLAIIYLIIGLVSGGFSRPDGQSEWLLLIGSILLSVIVGWARGRFTRIWRADDDRVYSQGTPLTISLFLLLVVAKFGIGTVAYFLRISDDGGFGEILVMIAVMVGFQSEIVWRRARPLGARVTTKDPVAGSGS